MSYQRVIPRDLFNEANLLKCYGQLSLLIHDYKFKARPELVYEPVHYQDSDDGPYREDRFDIYQDSDGGLYINNLEFYVHDHLVALRRPLNSREPYPLYASSWEWEQSIKVFDDGGALTPEMLALLNSETFPK